MLRAAHKYSCKRLLLPSERQRCSSHPRRCEESPAGRIPCCVGRFIQSLKLLQNDGRREGSNLRLQVLARAGHRVGHRWTKPCQGDAASKNAKSFGYTAGARMGRASTLSSKLAAPATSYLPSLALRSARSNWNHDSFPLPSSTPGRAASSEPPAARRVAPGFVFRRPVWREL
jgi:hypothetical protein